MMIVESTYRKLGTAPPISVTQRSQEEKYKVLFSGLQKKKTFFCTTLLWWISVQLCSGGCHKNCFTLAVVGPTETLPTLSSCSQERSPDFSHIFSRESPECLFSKGKSLGITLTLQFIHVTKITIFVIT